MTTIIIIIAVFAIARFVAFAISNLFNKEVVAAAEQQSNTSVEITALVPVGCQALAVRNVAVVPTMTTALTVLPCRALVPVGCQALVPVVNSYNDEGNDGGFWFRKHVFAEDVAIEVENVESADLQNVTFWQLIYIEGVKLCKSYDVHDVSLHEIVHIAGVIAKNVKLYKLTLLRNNVVVQTGVIENVHIKKTVLLEGHFEDYSIGDIDIREGTVDCGGNKVIDNVTVTNCDQVTEFIDLRLPKEWLEYSGDPSNYLEEFRYYNILGHVTVVFRLNGFMPLDDIENLVLDTLAERLTAEEAEGLKSVNVHLWGAQLAYTGTTMEIDGVEFKLY